MKKYLSVIMLYNRMIIKGSCLAILLMLAGDYALFYIRGGFEAASFGIGVEKSWLYHVFLICLGIVALFPTLYSGKKSCSSCSYTLLRLNISEKAVCFCDMAARIMNFLLLWAAQLIIIILLAYTYQHGTSASGKTLGIILDFYRNDFIYGLYPIDNLLKAAQNVLCLIGLSEGLAIFERDIRSEKTGEKSVGTTILLGLLIGWSMGGMRTEGQWTIVIIIEMIIIAGAMTACMVTLLRHAHNGERMVEQDEE